MFHKISNKIKASVIVAVIAISSLASMSFVDSYFEITKNLDIFTTLFRELNLYYVDDTDPGDLMKNGIDAMLESLDPYTNYISESEIEDYRFMTTGQYGGIGALIRKKGDFIIIAEPYEGFPAQKSGLEAGDIVLEINGKSIEGKSTNDISKILKGQPNTAVKLLLRKEDDKKTFEKNIIREEIKVKSVPYYGMLDDKTGYINLSSFTDNCSKELKDAFNELKSDKKMKRLVLDLRGNPGGLLKEAVDICNFFVEKGQLIVSTKGKVKEWSSTYKAANLPLDTEMPISVLVSSGSASASEIVSGTIQDLDRGIVVGQRTYGKGLVQTTRPLSYNSQLKVTTAKYYIPSGRCIQAINYAQKNDDGSVAKVPDSLMKKFETIRNKRTVYDGGGVYPDIHLENKVYSHISRSLNEKNLIFDFATRFYTKNKTIAPAKDFVISDEIFKDFTNFISGKDYDYTTSTEDMIEKFKTTAEKEKYFTEVEPEFEALKKKLKHNKAVDIEKHKEEIKELLKSEIVSRYYFQKGRIEATLKTDPEVVEAMSVLADKARYNKLLETSLPKPNGNGKH